MAKRQPVTVNKPGAVTNKKTKPWAVMIYMAADNNLSEECVYALKEIQRLSPFKNIEVVAQFDSSAIGVPTKFYDFTNSPKSVAVRAAVASAQHNGDGDLDLLATGPRSKRKNDSSPHKKATISQPVGQWATSQNGFGLLEDKSAADPTVLEEFISTSVRDYQADNYLVILSGHGSGAVGDFLKDENPPRTLSIPNLRRALASVKLELEKQQQNKIAILGMDSCLMSMVEVCYEVAGAVQFLVGAEGFELNTGWPYHRILEVLETQPGMKPEELAREIVRIYTCYYSDYVVAGISADQAACQLSRIDELALAIENLAAELRQRVDDRYFQNAILLAHWRAQSYKNEQYVDLLDFCELLQKDLGEIDTQDNKRAEGGKKIRDACDSVKSLVKEVVRSSCFTGATFQHSHGISIYFPWSFNTEDISQFKDLNEYKNLAFHKATTWGDFLSDYLVATRRKMRGEDESSPAASTGEQKKTCIFPADETILLVRTGPPEDRTGPPEDRGQRRRAGGMKNPPVCFIPTTCEGGCGNNGKKTKS